MYESFEKKNPVPKVRTGQFYHDTAETVANVIRQKFKSFAILLITGSLDHLMDAEFIAF